MEKTKNRKTTRKIEGLTDFYIWNIDKKYIGKEIIVNGELMKVGIEEGYPRAFILHGSKKVIRFPHIWFTGKTNKKDNAVYAD